MKKILIIAVLAIQAVSALALSNVERGDSAYSKSAYTEALGYYTEALNKEGSSSNLYYNIGNTYFRLNDLGHAVINYERALMVDPSNEDASTNLEFVKTKIQDKPEDDSTFLSNVHQNIIAMHSPDAWAWIAFTLFVIVIGAIAVYLFTTNINVRKAGFFGGIVVLVVFLYVLSVAKSAADAVDDHEQAVVIVPSTNLRSEPQTAQSKTDKVVPIHEGTKLIIVDSLATPDDPATMMWYDVKINNSTRAWVSSADVERL
jgi:tetratricopeptide (TPR) repeat protein